MSESATLLLPHYGTRLPSSFYAPPSGNKSQASPTRSSVPESFEDWLFGKARTENGRFPDWDYLRDYARALVEGYALAQTGDDGDLVVLKRRQILISWVTAAWFHWTASRNDYHHCAVISAGQREAAKQGRRIRTVAWHDGYPVSGVDLIKYPNGSDITVFPSTEHAGVGESLKLLHMDEFAFHPYAQQNLDTIRPAISNSNGQIIITSTANPQMGATGPFVDIWELTAAERKLFYGRTVRPDQGPEFFAKEAAKPGMSDEVMSAYYPLTPDDAFVARTGLVFPEFSPALHVRKAPVGWADCKWRVVGIDPGGGDPTAIVPIGVTQAEHMHQYGEFYRRGDVDLEMILEYLGKLNAVAPIDRVFVGETNGNVLVNTLQRNGYPAFKADMRREGIETMRWLLQRGRLTVAPEATNSIAEFRSYRWVQGRDQMTGERYATGRAADNHADAHDARRYAVMGVIRGLPSPRQGRPMRVDYGRQV